jgi:glycosyltransferase involved in cell wall biosynthesis
MPVYNGERFLRPAIESILTQTHRNLELLVIDDGSSDHSSQIASSYDDKRLTVITLPNNRGLAHALNEGIAAARAPFIARQDQDDISEPARLERQLAFLRQHDTIALVGSQGTVINDRGGIIGEVRRPTSRNSLRWFSIFDNPFVHTSIVVRANVLRRSGGYDPAYDPFAQDHELWGRIMELGDPANLGERLVRYRVNDTSTMADVQAGSAENGQRQRFVAIMQRLAVGQARRVLGNDAAVDADGALLAGMVGGLPPASVSAFLDMYERLLAAFMARHPVVDDDFSWTIARQFDAVSYRVRPSSRASALQIYVHLLRHHPEVARHVSWMRALTLLVAGRRGRDRLRRMIRRW